MIARIDLCLLESLSIVGFEHGVFATKLSLQKSFSWFVFPSFWWERQGGADVHLKQYCRHLFSVDMGCIQSLGIVFCDCSIFCRGCPWTCNGCIEN